MTTIKIFHNTQMKAFPCAVLVWIPLHQTHATAIMSFTFSNVVLSFYVFPHSHLPRDLSKHGGNSGFAQRDTELVISVTYTELVISVTYALSEVETRLKKNIVSLISCQM